MLLHMLRIDSKFSAYEKGNMPPVSNFCCLPNISNAVKFRFQRCTAAGHDSRVCPHHSLPEPFPLRYRWICTCAVGSYVLCTLRHAPPAHSPGRYSSPYASCTLEPVCSRLYVACGTSAHVYQGRFAALGPVQLLFHRFYPH